MPLPNRLPKLIASRRKLALAALAGGILIAFFGLPRLLGPKVVVVTAGQGELLQSVVASGKVRSPRRVELSSQISGRVTQVAAREGQAVAASDLLIQLDDGEWRAAVAQATATLHQSATRLAQMRQLTQPLAEQAQLQSEANLTQVRRNFERTRDLAAKGFFSKNQLDDARRNLEIAESQFRTTQLQVRSNQAGGSDFRLAEAAVAQARASLTLAIAKLGYARIVAPVAGTVLTRAVDPGHTAQPGKLLMTLSPAGTTELLVQIDEKNLGLLKLGQTAQASADAYPDRRFAAEINFISPAIDPLRGSVEIRLQVPEPPDYLRQEMTVSIDIETARHANALVVPADAVRDAGGRQPWVLVVRDGVVQRQDIELGARSDGKVEIRHGITAGEQLIPASQPAPPVGSRVRVS